MPNLQAIRALKLEEESIGEGAELGMEGSRRAERTGAENERQEGMQVASTGGILDQRGRRAKVGKDDL